MPLFLILTLLGTGSVSDRIYEALKSHPQQKALLIVSDGEDCDSRHSEAELLAAAREAGITIYSIAVFDPPRNQKAIASTDARQGVAYFGDLSRKTGGTQIVVRSADEIPDAESQLLKTLQSGNR